MGPSSQPGPVNQIAANGMVLSVCCKWDGVVCLLQMGWCCLLSGGVHRHNLTKRSYVCLAATSGGQGTSCRPKRRRPHLVHDGRWRRTCLQPRTE
jgi:hypothetical protein